MLIWDKDCSDKSQELIFSNLLFWTPQKREDVVIGDLI